MSVLPTDPPSTVKRIYQTSIPATLPNISASLQYVNWGITSNPCKRCYFADQTRDSVVTGMVYGTDNDSANVVNVQFQLRRNGSVIEILNFSNGGNRGRSFIVNWASEHVFEPGDYADLEIRKLDGNDGNDQSLSLIYYNEV